MRKFIYSLLFLAISYSVNAQWVQVWNGMGQTEAIRSLYYNGTKLFAGLYLQGIYVSTNEGLTWSQTSVQYWNTVNVIKLMNSNIFAGTSTVSGGRIYKSTDNGTTWNNISEIFSPYCFISSGSNLLGGSYSNGVYFSTNNGTNWTQTYLNNKTVFSLEQKDNYIIAGTAGSGIYYSTDNGNVWAQSGFNNKTVRTLCAVGQTVFAGTESFGIYSSSDNGITWSQLGLNNFTILNIINNGSVLFAGTSSNGVYMSSNNGLNWSAINDGFPSNTSVYSLTFTNNYIIAGTDGTSVYRRPNTFSPPSAPTLISPVNNATGISLTPTLDWTDVSGANTYGLQVSTNSNFASTVVNVTGLTSSQYSIPTSMLSSNTLYYWRANAINGNGASNWSSVWSFTTLQNQTPVPPTLIYPTNGANNISLTPNLDFSDVSGANTYGVQISTNINFTTTVVNVAGLTSSHYTVPSGILASNTQYYWRANATNGNGTSGWSSVWNFTTYANLTGWVQMSGMSNKRVRALCINGTNIYAGVTDTGVYISTNNGNNFTQSSLNNLYTNAVISNNSFLFAGGNQGIYFSSDNGLNWNMTNYSGLSVLSLAINSTNILFELSITGFYSSSNNGVNWTMLQAPTVVFNPNSLVINNDNLFCAGYNGLYRSTNNGSNWDKILPTYGLGWSIYSNGNNIYFATDDSIFISTNNGNNWSHKISPSPQIWSFVSNGNNVIAGSSNGIYLSTNNGISWTQKNEGFGGNPIVKSIMIANNYVYAGTDGQSVWRRPFFEFFIGIKNISEKTPNKFSLTQNYPNPFNPTTKIQFDVVKLGEVRIVVYDVMGREIQTLVNESLKPGTYETTFDGSQLTSGIYYYRLQAGEYSETKRMTLIK